MRSIAPDLAAQLAGETATLCHAWRLIRRDGFVIGFTDHDRDLVLDGTIFRARAGLEAAEITAELGLAVGGGEVSGALTSAEITEADLAAGLYDEASIETSLVDWTAPSRRLLLDLATLGEIRRGETSFVAELRGIAHRYDEERGRIVRSTCDADLGDARCGIDLTQPAYRAEVTVAIAQGRLGFLTEDLAAHEAGGFDGGRLLWLTGGNAGLSVEIKAQARQSGGDAVALWQPAAHAIAAGDTARLTAGCDKRFATCRDRFANALNFRGFPHMPGNDFVLRHAGAGEGTMDGGSLFR